jgi:hypothetical protein
MWTDAAPERQPAERMVSRKPRILLDVDPYEPAAGRDQVAAQAAATTAARERADRFESSAIPI